ncbi:MAG: hypothetical protein LBQ40_05615 [Clostridiales bacterium]|jgi:hypothetical protein|nr:hypothetical protein [Clostridiales bacterium]
MVFLERLFENYFREYIKSNAVRGRENIEAEYLSALDVWKAAPNAALSGRSPLEYLGGLYASNGLAGYIDGVCKTGAKVGDVTSEFVDGIEPESARAEMLRGLFLTGCERARLFAVEKLASAAADGTTEFILDIIIAAEKYSAPVVDAAFNALKDGRQGLDCLIFKKTDGLQALRDGEAKDMLLDILSGYPTDAATLGLITQGFLSGENTVFYAGLLGRCGNVGSVGVLKEYLASKEPTREEYLEIRSAIERIGE